VAITALPAVIGAVVAGTFLAGLFAQGFNTARQQVPPEQVVGLVISGLILAPVLLLLVLVWLAAVTIATDAVVHGRPASVLGSYAAAVGSLLRLVGAIIVYGAAAAVLFLGGSILFVLTLFGTLGSLIALICLIVWWRNPSARNPFLKWVIILTTPFGIAYYYTVRWALFTPAAVLERAGPVACIQRSSALVRGEWFRVFAFLFLLGIILALLQTIPSGLIQAAVFAASASSPGGANEMIGFIVSQAASLIGQIIFASLSPIGATLLFLDLRNRREGADLSERLGALEVGGGR
jgi:hypothetical protein